MSKKLNKQKTAQIVAPKATASPGKNEQTVLQPEEKKPLTEHERIALTTCENTLRMHQGVFRAMGWALKTIKEGSLQRMTGKTFEEYCRDTWSLSDKHAYRLIKAAECMEKLDQELSPIGEKRLPVNESQVRELLELDEKQWVKAWQQVLKSTDGKAITAEVVANAVAKILGKTETPVAVVKPKASGVKVAAKKLTTIARLVTEALAEAKPTVEQLQEALREIQKVLPKEKAKAK
jgi:hypothetical protein